MFIGKGKIIKVLFYVEGGNKTYELTYNPV
jgi:hypothetical protein